VELVDVFPTLAELASLPAPQGLDGRSLVPMLANPQAPGRVAVLSQFARPFKASTPEVMGYSLRTPTHRYTRWITLPARKLVAEELYTYTTGPSTRREGAFWIEQENLAPHPSQADTRQALSQKLDQILTERITSQSQPQLAPRKQKRKDTQP
jgi:iduronate 2-sulfatase